jgi:DNA (cytosine-5)-methyltransferase 1
MGMNVAGLFAGIGGLELGFERAEAGFRSVMLCEIEPRARAVLHTSFGHLDPEQLPADVRSKSLRLADDVDLVCGGFPCQDLSQAGRTAGITGARSGLVDHVFRLLDERKARKKPVPIVVLENVSFMLRLGGGHAMTHVLTELERLGYRWAYRVLNTLGFGLPQRRERVFIVATLDMDPGRILFASDHEEVLPETDFEYLFHGFYWTEGIRGLGWAPDAVPTLKNGSALGIASPPAIITPTGEIFTPDIRDAERLQGFPADFTQPAEALGRASFRWSLVGNAVSVPVAQWVATQIANPAPSWDSTLRSPMTRGWPRAAIGRQLRGGRVERSAVDVGPFPISVTRPHLHDFLEYKRHPLSERAVKGFASRLKNTSLNLPRGFEDAVCAYRDGFERAATTSVNAVLSDQAA